MVMDFVRELLSRDTVLGYFGLGNFALAVLLIVFAPFNRRRIAGAPALNKPIKFALSIGILSWSMSWYLYDLAPGAYLQAYRWGTAGLLGFEIVYITLMAILGKRSHFNVGHPLTSALYAAMGIAATVVTLWTGYIGIHFIRQEIHHLPQYYTWSIALGTLLFAVFGMEGALMGSRMAHTIGAPDGGKGLPFLNWSRTHGDARVAHFVGMHALQVLPLLSYYLLRDTRLVLAATGLYALLALWTLAQALRARPLMPLKGGRA